MLVFLGILLLAGAAGLTGWNLLDEERASGRERTVLEQLLKEVDPDPVPPSGRSVRERKDADPRCADELEYPDYIVNPQKPLPVCTIDGVDYIGYIEIPALGIRLPVAANAEKPILKIAPCWYEGSPYLDDLVLCAHNYPAFFGRIRELRTGDGVIFTDMDGNVFRYRLAELEILEATAVSRMINSEWDLTLYTCTIGGVSRVTARCEKVE